MLGLVKSCIGTKFTSQFGDLIAVSSCFYDKDYVIGVTLFSFSFDPFDLKYRVMGV